MIDLVESSKNNPAVASTSCFCIEVDKEDPDSLNEGMRSWDEEEEVKPDGCEYCSGFERSKPGGAVERGLGIAPSAATRDGRTVWVVTGNNKLGGVSIGKYVVVVSSGKAGEEE